MSSLTSKFGPGLIFAALAVGISHLVQSTRAGAEFGLTLGLLIVGISMVKYPAFRFGALYSAATGHSLIDSYERQGRLALIAFIFAVSVDAFVGAAGVTLVTAGLMKYLLHLDLADAWATVSLLVGGALLLVVGKYRLFEGAIKFFVFVFSALTIVAAILALTQVDFSNVVWAAPVEFDRRNMLFMIAVAGVMPSAVTISLFHSEWVCAKAVLLGRPVTTSEAGFDFNFGYIGTICLAMCFLIMGTTLIFNPGIVIAEGATGFAEQLIGLFAQTLGHWAYLVISVAAFAVMLSSTIALLDGCPRAAARVVQALRSESGRGGEPSRRLYLWLLAVQVLGASLIVLFFLKSFRTFIDFAASVAFLSAPFLGYFNHRAMVSEDVPVELRPSPFMRAWSIGGIIILALCACLYLYFKFTGT